GIALMGEVDALAGFSPDFGQVLDDIAATLHRIQLQQLVPGVAGDEADADEVDIAALAARLAPELVQLWYQMAIGGRRDLPLAPSQRAGFEMALLRMLAFRPASTNAVEITEDGSPLKATPTPSKGTIATPRDGIRTADHAVASSVPSPQRSGMPVRESMIERIDPMPTPAKAIDAIDVAKQVVVPENTSTTGVLLRDADGWLALIADAGLKGPTRDFAAHATFISYADGLLTLAMPDGLDHLRTDAMTGKLADALAPVLGRAPRIAFSVSTTAGDSLHARNARQRDERQADAERTFLENPSVRRYMQQYGAKLVPDSIRPADEN
ncbi:MAG TPA: DNA polymerase III subunit gamma/tau, partial [Xanthomonadaceae bacterium]|nr:DNA polymerase III subunit gamma/tau [Xanthomonadaceae bacterium]